MIFREVFHSPIGKLLITADYAAIVSIAFDGASVGENPSELTDRCAKQLAEYFGNLRTTFELPLAPRGTAFQQSVWHQLQQIPFGKSISYSELATSLGDQKKVRAVGMANSKNKLPIIIPCHRVIGKNGSLTGFAGGLDKKEWMLRHEGIINGRQMTIFGR